MTAAVTWQETESAVHHPGLWVMFTVGAAFVLAAGLCLVAIGHAELAGPALWGARAFLSLFALSGLAALAWAAKRACFSPTVRHAASDVLPSVPAEPVVIEGSTVHGGLTHQLSETERGWELRPAPRGWLINQLFLFGFGGPFLIFFSGLLSWVLHSRMHVAGWPLSIVLGVLLTAMTGGSCVLVIGLLMRAGYRRLATLSVPHNGEDLVLDEPNAPDFGKADLTDGLKWLFSGAYERRRQAIRREHVVAVQLCPWKFVCKSSGDRTTTWAAQGLLVLSADVQGTYRRLPLLLSGDFVGAARLMRRLADTLGVPYLFSGDARGWSAEAKRATSRPPLRAGGYMS